MTTLFDRQKAEKLSKVDLSRKGSVDAPIFDFLKNLNSHPDYVSLSSCSGRIIIFISGENIKKVKDTILFGRSKYFVDIYLGAFKFYGPSRGKSLLESLQLFFPTDSHP